ncbi:MAG: type II toxin-antitoxin system YafQ family toxin [Desulfamplus sp.]|nr:type II toxin-antitoxin system YafQ family toxin [Desulfamplus sp.]
MEIAFSTSFKRAFKNRIQGKKDLEENFWEKVALFKINPFDSKLKTHKLSGKLKDLWAFSVGYDLRVVLNFIEDKKALFIDIGKHDEVY